MVELVGNTLKIKSMIIDRNVIQELQELQEDTASHFADENLISGEVYWTCVEALATTKLAELRGELSAVY